MTILEHGMDHDAYKYGLQAQEMADDAYWYQKHLNSSDQKKESIKLTNGDAPAASPQKKSNGEKNTEENETTNTFTLRPYQLDICEQVNQSQGNVLLEAPTGAGKTIISKQIAQDEIDKGGKVLVVVPKLVLMRQTEDTYASLNPQVIHGKRQYDPNHTIFITTIQTAYKRDLGFTPTIIIVDEIHHGFKGSMLEKLRHGFSGRIVGLSATPYDNNGKVLQGFGLHINQYDQKYMIENGYLVPPLPYVLMSVELKGIRKTNGDYNLGDLSSRFNNIETVSQVVAVTKPYIIKRKQALVFCIDIQHSEAMAKAYNAAGISAAAMHSKLSPEEREQTMEAFKTGDIKLLTNPEILTTGFDHPRVDTIVLARSTQSQNLYKQMVGRGLRLSDGKESALVLDCAGVIENLGMPTDPIRPRQNKEIANTKMRCANCESTRLYRTVRGNMSFWVCPECGTEKEIAKPISCVCKKCKKAYGNDAKFVSTDDSLYLECDCGTQTLISEPTSTEDLGAIFNDRLITMIQNRVVRQYLSFLIDKKGAAFIATKPAREQIDKLLRFIKNNPTKINNLNPHAFGEDDEWRIIYTEGELAVKKYQRNIKNFLLSSTLNEAIRYLNKILVMRQKPSISPVEAHMFKQQTGEAFDSETEVVQHLKSIYKRNKQSITDVISYILRTKREYKKYILQRHTDED